MCHLRVTLNPQNPGFEPIVLTAGRLERLARPNEPGRGRAARVLPVGRDGRGAGVDAGEQRAEQRRAVRGSYRAST